MEKEIKIPVEVSARHVHLSRPDLEKIFGKSYELRKMKDLTQPCDFAAQETLEVRVGHRRISNVRVVGPVRKQTQVELSLTDAVSLGIHPPLKISGDLNNSAGAFLVGPEGRVELKEGVVIAQRHLHLKINEAKKMRLKDGDIVSARITGERAVLFENILVRVGKDYRACLHLDTDEGNAAGINRRGEAVIIKKASNGKSSRK